MKAQQGASKSEVAASREELYEEMRGKISLASTVGAVSLKRKVPEELYNLRGIRLVLVDYFWLPPSYYEDR